MAKAVLYLDIDGVVNFFGSRNQHRKKARLGYLRRGSVAAHGVLWEFDWSAELLHRLSAIDGLEIALLSTWNSHSRELFRVLDWSTDRVLPDASGGDACKLALLRDDQDENPLPFIWADDTATKGAPLFRELKARDSLIITPDEKFGLTALDLERIESFVAAQD